MLLTLVAHLSLAWFTTPSDLGRFFILFGVTNIVANAGSLGLGAAAIRFIPQFTSPSDAEFQAGYTIRTLQTTGSVSLCISGLAVLAAIFGDSLLGADVEAGVYLFAALLPPTSLQVVSLELFRAFGIPLQGQSVASIVPPVVLAVGAVLISELTHLSFENIGWIAVAAASATAAVQLYWLWRLVLSRFRGCNIKSATRGWLRTSLPMMVSALIFLSAGSIDWLMLATLANAAESAIYRVGLSLLSIQGVFFATFYAVIGGYVSRNAREQSKEEYESFLRKINLVQMVVTGTVSIFLIVFAREILGLFGPDFVAGAESLRILVAAWLFRMSLGPQEMLLNLGEQERLVTVLNVLTIILLVPLSIILVPRYGLEGAAAAHAVAWSSTGILMTIAVVRKLGIRVAFHDQPLAWIRSKLGD
jgi:O-antigen/teichoic acid export membrane protein